MEDIYRKHGLNRQLNFFEFPHKTAILIDFSVGICYTNHQKTQTGDYIHYI